MPTILDGGGFKNNIKLRCRYVTIIKGFNLYINLDENKPLTAKIRHQVDSGTAKSKKLQSPQG